ncbi:hypothetical protein R1T08_14990 [Streptomyces sp. SBC-4]|nr:hypothetical protein [Streptomyces sp. SBC-4]MDV5145483.1 hypothetical protein [Streptomyces sp. SBC-4]
MTTRRGSAGAAGRLAAVAAGALVLAGLVPAPAAHAQAGEPTYRCVVLETENPPRAKGFACEALNGARPVGTVLGVFRIENQRGDAVRCEMGFGVITGFAELPHRVEGYFCYTE